MQLFSTNKLGDLPLTVDEEKQDDANPCVKALVFCIFLLLFVSLVSILASVSFVNRRINFNCAKRIEVLLKSHIIANVYSLGTSGTICEKFTKSTKFLLYTCHSRLNPSVCS